VLKNILSVAAVVSMLAIPVTAEAGNRHRHGHGNGAGIAFGVMGAIIGSAIIADQIRRDRERRESYRYVSRECAERWGWHTRRWDRCMRRRGY
jgi:uncharacterized protein YcfJ